MKQPEYYGENKKRVTNLERAKEKNQPYKRQPLTKGQMSQGKNELVLSEQKYGRVHSSVRRKC